MNKQHYFILIVFALTFQYNSNVFAQTKYVDSVLNWVKNNPKVDSQYILSLHRLSFRYYENDTKKSFEYYERVSTLSDSLNFTYGKSLAQINLGLLLSNSANFDGSNGAYFKAIDYAEICGAPRLKAISLNNIGENFKSLNDLGKCRQYTKEAIKLNIQLKSLFGVAVNYELLYRCDLTDKLYINARINLDSGMPYALKANDSYLLSQYYLGYGKLQAINYNIDSAKYFFNLAMREAISQNNLRNKYQVYRARAEYLKNLTQDKKIELLDSALLIAKQTHFLEGISQAAEQLSDEYDIMQNKDSSLHYYRIYRTVYDSVFSENDKRNVVIKEADWMIKRKEIENQHLKELSLLQKRDIIFKNALLAAIATLLLLIIATSFVIYKNIQSKKKQLEHSLKQKIAETQMQSLRAQMNPHFIFNSLNSIENFIMRNDKMAASEYLNKFAGLIRIILDSSRTELVPFTKNMEGIKLYVELEQLRFNNKFSFKINIDPDLLNGDYLVPSLLSQPYIENAILHGLSQSEAESLELSLNARLENDYIIYTISDNGIGRKKAEEYKNGNKRNHKSLGLQLIEERINIFNLQQNAEGGVTITDLYNDKNEPCGTRAELKIKAV